MLYFGSMIPDMIVGLEFLSDDQEGRGVPIVGTGLSGSGPWVFVAKKAQNDQAFFPQRVYVRHNNDGGGEFACMTAAAIEKTARNDCRNRGDGVTMDIIGDDEDAELLYRSHPQKAMY